MNYTLNYSKIFWIFSLVSMLALLVFLILQVNYFAGEVFLIESYKKNLVRLLDDKEILEINLAKSSSLQNIEHYLQSQNFEKADQMKYIQILESPVVKKR